jgi:hypothetical protein
VHAELIIAGPLASEARLPALELLLARGRRTDAEPQGAMDWLGRAFGLQALPAGALTAGEEGFWLRADPVHYRVMRDRVVIVPAADLDEPYAAALVDTLNRHFAGRHTFRAARPGAWVMSSAPAALDTVPTAPAAGAFDPPGAPWTALFNEIQMALHEHPANEGRETEVNGVWLWGAGELPRGLSAPWGSVTSRDPLVLGLARAAGLEHRAPPPTAAAWLAQAPGDGRHLVAPGALLEPLDAEWFAPLLAALRSGRIGMLTLHAPEEGFSVEAARRDLHRFWRRPRPLAAHAHR